MEMVMQDEKEGINFELRIDAQDGSVFFTVIPNLSEELRQLIFIDEVETGEKKRIIRQLDFSCSEKDWEILKDFVYKKLKDEKQ